MRNARLVLQFALGVRDGGGKRPAQYRTVRQRWIGAISVGCGCRSRHCRPIGFCGGLLWLTGRPVFAGYACGHAGFKRVELIPDIGKVLVGRIVPEAGRLRFNLLTESYSF